MATVTKSIGTTSRDFSTITLWEADLDDDPTYDSGDVAVGECYDDSAFDENVVFNGGGTIGLASATLTVPSAERHDGTAGTGVRVVATTADLILDLQPAMNLLIDWIECDGNGGGANTGVVKTNQANVDKILNHLLVHNLSSGSSNTGIFIENPEINSDNTRTLNCIVYDIAGTASGRSSGVKTDSFEATRKTRLLNITIHDITNSSSGDAHCVFIASANSAAIIQNVIGTDTSSNSGTATDFSANYATAETTDHNLSSDTTATGTGSLISKSAANQFVSTTGGSEDLHLKSGADAIDAGTDLGTTPSGVQFDIDNRDRDAQGDTWDMGADEFVAAAAAPDEDAGLFIAGQQQPVINPIEIVAY